MQNISLKNKFLFLALLFFASTNQAFAMEPLQPKLNTLKNSLSELKTKLTTLSNKLIALKNRLGGDKTEKTFVIDDNTELTYSANSSGIAEKVQNGKIILNDKSVVICSDKYDKTLCRVYIANVKGKGPIGIYDKLVITEKLSLEKIKKEFEEHKVNWQFNSINLYISSDPNPDNKLKEISIAGDTFKELCLFDLIALEAVNLKDNNSITSLNIDNCPKLDIQKIISACPKLIDLLLRHQDTVNLDTKNSVKALIITDCPKLDIQKIISACPNLKELQLCYQDTVNLNTKDSVETLAIMHCPKLDIQKIISAYPNLTELRLDYQDTVNLDTKNSIETLKIMSCPKLDIQKIISACLKLKNLSLTNFPNLESLNLKACPDLNTRWLD
jgi:hypothetical protein